MTTDHLCFCGCGETPSPEKFLVQGHDMRVNSDLLHHIDGDTLDLVAFVEKHTGRPVNRHFSDAIEIRGNRTTVPGPRELHPFRSHPMARFWRSALV